MLCRDYCSSSCLGEADRWPLTMAHVNMCAPGSSRKWQHPLHECWGVIWIIQGSPKRQRLSDCVRWRTPSVQKRHLVTLDQHLAPFRYLFANADLLPQYLSREGGPPGAPEQSAIPSKPNAALCIPTNTCVWAIMGIADVHERMQNRCMHRNVRRNCPDF